MDPKHHLVRLHSGKDQKNILNITTKYKFGTYELTKRMHFSSLKEVLQGDDTIGPI